MTDEPHPLDYEATVKRMEPGISPMAPEIALASIAISMVTLNKQVGAVIQRLDDLRYAINQVSNNGQHISAAVNGLNSSINSAAAMAAHSIVEVIKARDNVAQKKP